MRLEAPAFAAAHPLQRIDVALPGAATPAPTASPKLVTPSAPRTSGDRAGFWRSLAAWSAVGVVSGLVNAGLRVAFYAGVRSAFEPLVLKVNSTAQESLGARFNDSWSNPLKAAVARFAVPKPKLTHTTRNHFYPELADQCLAAFKRRRQVDGRVLDQLDPFFTGFMPMFQLVCNGVQQRLQAGDIHGAARRLGATFVHDRTLRYEISPHAHNLFDTLFVRSAPYFRDLTDAQRIELREDTLREVARFTRDEEKPLARDYAIAMLDGLTSDVTDRRAKERPVLMLEDNALADVARTLSRGELAACVTKADAGKSLGEHVEDLFRKAMAGKSLAKRIGAARLRKRIARAVTSDLRAFEERAQRQATLQELWGLVLTAFEVASSRELEKRATVASVAAFVTVGAIAAAPKAATGQLSPALSSAVDPVVYTVVSYFMSASGRFFKERLDAFGRTFSYRTPTKLSLGEAFERDLLNVFLRNLAVDGRLSGVRAAFMQFERMLHLSVIDAEDSIRKGDLDTAALFLSGMMQYVRQIFFEFSPLTRCFELVAIKLGPHFDTLSADQRQDLYQRVMRDLIANDTDDEAIRTYYSPMISMLLQRNPFS